MPDAEPTWLRQHAVGIIVGIITFVWFTVELLAKRKHGDDYVLTAINVGVTLLLWLLLVIAIGKYWRDGRRSKSLAAQIVTLKDEHATQRAGWEKQRAGLEEQYQEEIRIARQQHANNETGLMKLKQDYMDKAKAATERAESLQQEITAKDAEIAALKPVDLNKNPWDGVLDEPPPTAVTDNDPRIYVEIIDRRFGGDTLRPSDAKVVLSLINRGGSEATNIHVKDIQLRREKIVFEVASSVVAVKESATAIPVLRDGDRGIMQQHDLQTAFFAEWDSHNSLKREEETALLVVTYCDFNSNVIQTTCELVFSPHIAGNIAHGLSHSQSSFSTRNFKFERITARLP